MLKRREGQLGINYNGSVYWNNYSNGEHTFTFVFERFTKEEQKEINKQHRIKKLEELTDGLTPDEIKTALKIN